MRFGFGVAVTGVLCLTVLRLVIASVAPLHSDEAYYWLWSRHLATGYFDHPPLIAYVIRAGTLVFGDTPLGVRFGSILLTLPASFAVWRTADILWRDRELAASAAVFFNLTLFVAVCMLVSTPDAPLTCASAFFALFLAKLLDTGKGVWWLAAGAAGGFGLLSKYTAFFWPFTVLFLFLLLPEARRWLKTPWPWLGCALALIIFAPNFAWNAEHQWISFRKQFGHVYVPGLTLRYLPELIAAQFGMLTPPVFLLGSLTLVSFLRGCGERHPRALVLALVLPLSLYFVWHSLHERVEANWPSPIAPGFALAAAGATRAIDWRGGAQRVVRLLSAFAVPIGMAMTLAIYVQAATGILSFGWRDPISHSLGFGVPEMAREVDTLAKREGAVAILTKDYWLPSWFGFYLPRSTPIFPFRQRYRWTFDPTPFPDLRSGTFLYVAKLGSDTAPLAKDFARVEEIARIVRRRGPIALETFVVYRLGHSAN